MLSVWDMSSLLCIIRIFTPTLSPPWFHSVTLSHYSALCAPPTHLPVQPHPPPPPPTSCIAWGWVRVRACRLPLIWVSAIQFSGRCKPGQCHTPPPPPPISLTCPGHKTCRQPHMVLKVPPHTPLPPHRYPQTASSFPVLTSFSVLLDSSQNFND